MVLLYRTSTRRATHTRSSVKFCDIDDDDRAAANDHDVVVNVDGQQQQQEEEGIITTYDDVGRSAISSIRFLSFGLSIFWFIVGIKYIFFYGHYHPSSPSSSTRASE